MINISVVMHINFILFFTVFSFQRVYGFNVLIFNKNQNLSIRPYFASFVYFFTSFNWTISATSPIEHFLVLSISGPNIILHS